MACWVCQLWECKLAIIHCAGHSEPQLVCQLWTRIIQHTLERTQTMDAVEARVDALAAKVRGRTMFLFEFVKRIKYQSFILSTPVTL